VKQPICSTPIFLRTSHPWMKASLLEDVESDHR